jgi:F420-dependent oxidoreductase-like protein
MNIEEDRKMKIGLHIGKFDWPGSPENISETIADIAQTADEAGFYSLWVMDHLFQLGERYGIVHGPVEAAMLEGYSTISYLAAVTRDIKLGLMVTCNFFREPGLLVKTVSTIDVLSKGRAYLGLGAGWFERESVGLGFHYPSLKERFIRLEETLQIAKQMWAGDTQPYNGQYYQLAEPINNPQPLSKPHPPIMIGGGGEKKTLRLVAQYADACNFVILSQLEDAGVLQETREDSLARLKRKLEVLEQHCLDIGRPFDEIEKTAVTYIKLAESATTIEDVKLLCRQLSDLGFEHVIFNMPNVHEIEPLRIMGEKVIPVI